MSPQVNYLAEQKICQGLSVCIIIWEEVSILQKEAISGYRAKTSGIQALTHKCAPCVRCLVIYLDLCRASELSHCGARVPRENELV